jgi:hypothetical protein
MGRVIGGFAGATAIVLASLFGGTARADDGSDLWTKLSAAQASVTSMQMTVRSTVPGYTAGGPAVVITFVSPHMVSTVSNMGGSEISAYYMGDGFLYTHAATVWRKFPRAPEASDELKTRLKGILGSRQIVILPDRVEDGQTVGVYQSVTAPPDAASPPVSALASKSVTCSYDKKTYLARICTDATTVVTFSRYNDPTLAVELPPDSKAAILAH